MNWPRRRLRHCPMCREKLEQAGQRRRIWICRRCLLVLHGDTFEPIKPEALGSASSYDLFF